VTVAIRPGSSCFVFKFKLSYLNLYLFSKHEDAMKMVQEQNQGRIALARVRRGYLNLVSLHKIPSTLAPLDECSPCTVRYCFGAHPGSKFFKLFCLLRIISGRQSWGMRMGRCKILANGDELLFVNFDTQVSFSCECQRINCPIC
jgi:hypothetical protein